MSALAGPDAQDALFRRKEAEVPVDLARATFRMEFPPSYVIVGLYRFFTDKSLYKPAWDKCKHAARRGAIVGAVWFVLTFYIQRGFVVLFMSNSASLTGLSGDTIFGYPVPFNVHTHTTLWVMSKQITFILKFFMARNLRIARERVWAQTVESRGKGPEFWKPYVEEWKNPPYVPEDQGTFKFFQTKVGRFMMQMGIRIALASFEIYPLIGILISGWLKGLSMAEYLHKPYFQAKGMTRHQTAVFVTERKWDYRIFGFVAALLDSIPIIGIMFSISNRVGAAMWAFDLEKRQHYVAGLQKQKDQ